MQYNMLYQQQLPGVCRQSAATYIVMKALHQLQHLHLLAAQLDPAARRVSWHRFSL